MKRVVLLALATTLAFAQGAKKPAPPAKAEPAKSAPAEAPKAKIQPSTGGFVGNKDSKIFHTADCKAGAKIKAEHKVTFASKAEAEKAGYKACKVCKPA